MSQQWRGPQDGNRGGRFSDERKPLVERPAVLMPPEFCWCGEQHGGSDKYKWAGYHPWPPLDDPEGVTDERG